MNSTIVQKDTFKSVDNNLVYYEVHGDKGPAIVLVYGVACLMNHWVYQVSELSKNHRVILFDYRGHHKSETTKKLNTDLVAKDVKALLDHLKIEKAHLVGHSFGVPVGVRFANLFPEALDRLVLINGFVYNPLDELFKIPVSQKLIQSLEVFQSYAPGASQWLWKKAVNNMFAQVGAGLLGGFNLEFIPFKDIEIYTQGLENLEVKVVLEYMKDLVNTDLRKDLKKVQSKSLVISGLRDGITPPHQQVLMKNLIPDCEIVKFKEGSHCTQLDLPEPVNEKLIHFFAASN